MPDTSKLEKLNRELEKSEKKLRKAINDEKALQHQLKQLVYTHYNLVVAVSGDTDIQKCTNHLENSFSRMGKDAAHCCAASAQLIGTVHCAVEDEDRARRNFLFHQVS